jgi:hypothetical protein
VIQIHFVKHDKKCLLLAAMVEAIATRNRFRTIIQILLISRLSALFLCPVAAVAKTSKPVNTG